MRQKAYSGSPLLYLPDNRSYFSIPILLPHGCTLYSHRCCLPTRTTQARGKTRPSSLISSGIQAGFSACRHLAARFREHSSHSLHSVFHLYNKSLQNKSPRSQFPLLWELQGLGFHLVQSPVSDNPHPPRFLSYYCTA